MAWRKQARDYRNECYCSYTGAENPNMGHQAWGVGVVSGTRVGHISLFRELKTVIELISKTPTNNVKEISGL